MRTEIRFALATVILFLTPHLARASFSDPASATASAMHPAMILTEDLKEGDLSLHPTAGYVSTTNATGTTGQVSLKGYGGSLTVTKSLNPHLGISVGGLYFRETGSYDPQTTSSGQSAGIAGSASANGWIGTAALVLDFFSGDGFRMPIIIGGNYENFNSSNPTVFDQTGRTLRSPGYSFGISPRFTLGWFRIQPFFMIDFPTKDAVNACNPGITGCNPNSSEDTGAVLGVNTIFTPWGLSFFYNMGNLILNQGSTYLSLGLRFSL